MLLLSLIILSNLVSAAREYPRPQINNRFTTLRRALLDRLLHPPCPNCGR